MKSDSPGEWTLAEEHTDNIQTRVMLFRMLMLQKRADRKIDLGNKYVVRSYAYWMEHLALTRHAVKKALNELREAGLIETEVRLVYGKTLLHMRLGPKLNQGCHTTGGLVVTQPSSGSGDGQPIDTEGNMESDMEEKTYGLLEPGGQKSILKPTIEQLLSGKPSFDQARKVWSVSWFASQEGPVDGFPQSPKARKMWKNFVSKVPDSHSALQLIARAVNSWPEFLEIVKLNKGQNLSLLPNLYHVIWNLPSLLEMVAPASVTLKPGALTPNEKAKAQLEKLMKNG